MNRWAVPTPIAGIGSAIAVAGLIFGIYVLTMPTVLPSGGAMAQTQAALRQPIELNPHHLLVTPIHRAALAIAGSDPRRAFIPIQILNAPRVIRHVCPTAIDIDDCAQRTSWRRRRTRGERDGHRDDSSERESSVHRLDSQRGVVMAAPPLDSDTLTGASSRCANCVT